MRLTVDTNILINAFEKYEPDHMSVVYGFGAPNGPHLNYDMQGVIVGEYENNVGSTIGFRKWYQRLHKLQAINYCDGKLSNRHREKLSLLGCHEPSDHTFVAVAYHSDKILISEDSDFGKGPKGNILPHCKALVYLNEKMGISVYDAKEALINVL